MVADADSAVSRERIQELRRREDETFAARTKQSARLAARARAHMPGSVPMAWMNGLYRTPPLYVTHGEGARFFDVDGNVYLDFNVCDLSMTMGFGPAPIVEAVSRQVARGAHHRTGRQGSARRPGRCHHLQSLSRQYFAVDYRHSHRHGR